MLNAQVALGEGRENTQTLLRPKTWSGYLLNRLDHAMKSPDFDNVNIRENKILSQ